MFAGRGVVIVGGHDRRGSRRRAPSGRRQSLFAVGAGSAVFASVGRGRTDRGGHGGDGGGGSGIYRLSVVHDVTVFDAILLAFVFQRVVAEIVTVIL